MVLRLLHYSDVENAYDDPERIGRLTSLLRKRTEITLVCGTGDTIAPGLLSMETNGTHAQHFFEAVVPDFATFGNHEFDNGISPLRDVVNASCRSNPQTRNTRCHVPRRTRRRYRHRCDRDLPRCVR